MSTLSINKIKDILDMELELYNVKVPCVVNDTMKTTLNIIRLFYVSGSFVSNTNQPYYNNTIQVTVRNADYDDARSQAYQCMNIINQQRKVTDTYFAPITAPEYIGEDQQIGGYVWGFNVDMRGAK